MKKTIIFVVFAVLLIAGVLVNWPREKIFIENPSDEAQQKQPIASGPLEDEIRTYYARVEKAMTSPTRDKEALIATLEKYLSNDYIHYDVRDKNADLRTIKPKTYPKSKQQTIEELREERDDYGKTEMIIEILDLSINEQNQEAIVEIRSRYEITPQKNQADEQPIPETHQVRCVDYFTKSERGVKMIKCLCKPEALL